MTTNYRPAGDSSDDDYDDKYGGFSFGYDDHGDDYYDSPSSRQPKVTLKY